ncbi:hypothetical protein JNG37_08605 [Streptococcus suis]|uniref:Uncharacterized protein n=1 Tax=Streptococcus suis TaxID=1307 RepID=A0A4T2GHQ7_STRSU|nr:hypothetical protein [Streptococcus suis]MBM7270605.1 hypothetical protein [Streptococcus suis]TIH98101.1 hypothetical protein FAJ39_09910 [Streptococcus suis]
MLIISLIENLLIEELGNYFRGILGKMRLKWFTKRLKNEIEYSVLKQYGNKSAVSNLLFSRNSSENIPLSNHVYEEIRNSLEEIFGKT